jgi:transcription elongation regulator 1
LFSLSPAAGGVLYWHNAATGASTYTRPAPVVPPPGFVSLPPPAPEKKKKKEKPKDKTPIPGTTWIRVKTTEGNVFYMDKESKKSEWTIPEAIKVGRPSIKSHS